MDRLRLAHVEQHSRRSGYWVEDDGQRILAGRVSGERETPGIAVVQNWYAEFEER